MDLNLKELLNNKRGVTLVEIVVSVALISLLGTVFLNILMDNFNQIEENKKNLKELLFDLSGINKSYRNTHQGVEENISFFDKNVTLRKIEGSNNKLDVFISDHENQEMPFLDENGNLLYDKEEKELTKSDIIDNYFTSNQGVLVIPSKKIFIGETIDSIDWYVDDGVYIDANISLNASNYIRIETNSFLKLNSTELKPIELFAQNNIELIAGEDLNIMQSFIDSNNSIILKGKNIYLNGTDILFTIIKYKNDLELNDVKNSEVEDINEIDGVESNSKTIIEVK